MKTVQHNPNVKRKPIIIHWSLLATPLLAALVIDTANHLLGNY